MGPLGERTVPPLLPTPIPRPPASTMDAAAGPSRCAIRPSSGNTAESPLVLPPPPLLLLAVLPSATATAAYGATREEDEEDEGATLPYPSFSVTSAATVDDEPPSIEDATVIIISLESSTISVRDVPLRCAPSPPPDDAAAKIVSVAAPPPPPPRRSAEDSSPDMADGADAPPANTTPPFTSAAASACDLLPRWPPHKLHRRRPHHDWPQQEGPPHRHSLQESREWPPQPLARPLAAWMAPFLCRGIQQHRSPTHHTHTRQSSRMRPTRKETEAGWTSHSSVSTNRATGGMVGEGEAPVPLGTGEGVPLEEEVGLPLHVHAMEDEAEGEAEGVSPPCNRRREEAAASAAVSARVGGS